MNSACLKRPVLTALAPIACVLSVVGARADLVVHNQEMRAVQNVSLLGVNAVLVAEGDALFTFDVDGNNNTVAGGGASTLSALFTGILPPEFAALGVAGAAFELFNNTPDVVESTGNGTQVRVETTFGLRVYVAPGVVGANFYTSVPSLFESGVVGLQDFTGSVFQDPARPADLTDIFVGANLLGLTPGSLVGVSFNRTVTAIPEPTALGLLAIVSGFPAFGVARRPRTRC